MNEGKITYLIGDATQPVGEGQKIIAHICNDIGAWGRGFVLALSKRWKEPERLYREYAKESHLPLGMVQWAQIDGDLWVVNMIAQAGIRPNAAGMPPIRYASLRSCLVGVRAPAIRGNSTIHMPRIGCGLAGGSWDKVEPIIQEELCAHGINVFVYDLNK